MSGTITVTIENAVNYAGRAMTERSTSSDKVEAKATSIEAEAGVLVDYRAVQVIEIQILPVEAGASKSLTVSSSSPSIASPFNSNNLTDENGKAFISVSGNLPGEAELSASLDETDLSCVIRVSVNDVREIINECEMVGVDIESLSEVEAGTLLTLTSATDGAEIYYTTDGSSPVDSSNASRILYASPIEINDDITIVAYAVKPGMNDSMVSAFSYKTIVRYSAGDVNEDGITDISDALMTARFDAGLIELNERQIKIADVNKDGVTEIGDALMIARYDAGFISSF